MLWRDQRLSFPYRGNGIEWFCMYFVCDRITKELREKMAKGLSEPSENSKRIIRDIRTTLLTSTKSSVKDETLRRQADVAVQKIYTDMIKKVDDLLASKHKEILSQ